jgi:hypothetical protein
MDDYRCNLCNLLPWDCECPPEEEFDYATAQSRIAVELYIPQFSGFGPGRSICRLGSYFALVNRFWRRVKFLPP